MSGKFFPIPTLFVYSLDGSSSAKARRATQLIRQAIATRKGIVSYQVVQEFFHVALRRFTPPMTVAEALHLRSRYGLSWYDSLIVASAIQAGCELLYTEDLQDGQKFGELRIENPFR